MLVPIFSSLSCLVALFVALFVILHNRKSPVNQSFSLLSLVIAFWIFTNLMIDLATNEFQGLLWSRLALVGPIFIPLFLLRFSTVFPSPVVSWKYVWIFLTIPALAILWFVPTPYNVASFHFVAPGQAEATPGFQPISAVHIDFGPLYIFFAWYFIVYCAAAVLFLIIGYQKSNQENRLRVKYLLVGVVSSLLLGVFTNALLPITGEARLTGIGPSTALIFLCLTVYAIVKHQLFEIRVVLTSLFVGFIAILLFVDATIFTDEYLLRITKLISWFIFLWFGYLLIKSVTREIKYREEIKKAYEVEKEAHKELERLDEAKTQFIMATQHHLRTPLTAMRGYTDLLLGGTYGKVTDKIKETIQKFEVSISKLIRTVNEILDVSQFQLGKEVVSLQPGVDVVPLVEELVEEIQFEIKTKGLFFKVENPATPLPKVKADPEKLKVALLNIFDNAVKYTPKGGVTVHYQVPDSFVRIIVQDTGIGISKDQLPTLFNRSFERGQEARETNVTGRGIGVFITGQIIKAHQGKVWAESEGKDKGSTFIVELPIEK